MVDIKVQISSSNLIQIVVQNITVIIGGSELPQNTKICNSGIRRVLDTPLQIIILKLN